MTLNYLTSKNLIDHKNNNFFHGFFTRKGGVSKKSFSSLNCGFVDGEIKQNVLKNRNIACQNFLAKNDYRLIVLNQIHSNKIINIDKERNFNQINGDGMITSYPKNILGILTADCAPIIFYGEKYVGIIHAGWKGLINGIISEIILLLKKNGELEKNISCSVGPHLKQRSFEVKIDFVQKLLEKSQDNDVFLSYKLNKIYFDASKFIEINLYAYGVRNFSISKYDTFSNPEMFFSYRRNKKSNEVCGRQISLVGIK